MEFFFHVKLNFIKKIFIQKIKIFILKKFKKKNRLN